MGKIDKVFKKAYKSNKKNQKLLSYSKKEANGAIDPDEIVDLKKLREDDVKPKVKDDSNERMEDLKDKLAARFHKYQEWNRKRDFLKDQLHHNEKEALKHKGKVDASLAYLGGSIVGVGSMALGVDASNKVHKKYISAKKKQENGEELSKEELKLVKNMEK